ncbi:MAG: tyrosine-type recombinase/integrase [Erysipelotrichaceae bacterium]|nr:tyrosine-type recombinase/integrase [Erysipelotrichaceae bacterium]
MISGCEITMNVNTKKKCKRSSYWTFEDGFEKFMNYCRIKNLRPKTLEYYQDNFHCFYEFIKSRTIYETINELTQADVNDYTLYLKDKGMRETSVNTYLRGFRALLYFWIEQKQCENMKVHIHKADKQVKETYTDAELFRLLRKPDITTCDFLTYRNWVIVNFFLATGVRVSTLINIKIQDIDFEMDRILLTHTKNRKSMLIPMSKQLKKTLQEYLYFRKGDQWDYFFCSQLGLRMTTDSVKHAITKYNKSRGVERCGLHAFRHTFAKRCVMNGVNVFVLQKLMGHSDLSITQEYVDLYADDLAIGIDDYNPLDTFGRQKIPAEKKKPAQIRKKITMQG